MEKITAQKLKKYINRLKKVDMVHKEIFGENKNLVTPVLISQGIVKRLLKLNDYKDGTEFDALKDGKTYEIKATSSDEGTTTINLKSKPDILVWIYIDYNNSKIIIKKKSNFGKIDTSQELFNEEAFKRQKVDIYKEALRDRVTIILKNIKWDDVSLTFDLNTLTPL